MSAAVFAMARPRSRWGGSTKKLFSRFEDFSVLRFRFPTISQTNPAASFVHKESPLLASLNFGALSALPQRGGLHYKPHSHGRPQGGRFLLWRFDSTGVDERL